MRSEERASGIDPGMTEIDIMLEEICEKEEVTEEEDETKKKNAKAEKESAEKMRLKAKDKLSESQKRKDSNEEARPKKSRKSIGDAVSYLQEKSKQEIAIKKEEIELKKQEEGRIAHLSEQQLEMNPAATPESAKTTRRTAEAAGEVAAATTSNYAVHSNPTATTDTSNVSFV